MKLLKRTKHKAKKPTGVEGLVQVAARIDRHHAKHVVNDAIQRMLAIERIERLERRGEAAQPIAIDAQGKPVVDPLLTSAEVQAELDIGHDHLNDLKQVRALSWARIGKGDRFRRSEVDRFIERMKIPSERQRVNRAIAELKAERKAKRAISLRAIR